MELQEIIATISDDINDPESMEKILVYLDELHAKDEEFIELLVSKMGEEIVTWHQPWYQRVAGVTRRLENSKEEEEQFQTGSFNQEEKKIVAKNWKKLRKKFELPDTPECFARWKNKKNSRSPLTQVEKVRNFVTAFLAQNLERNLYQVYQFFVAEYGAPVKGNFTPAEEKIIEICYNNDPKNAASIAAAVLGRERRGINKRVLIMRNGKPDKKRLKWNLATATKLVQSLLRHTELPLEKLKNAYIEPSVWVKVGEDMEQQPAYLARFWYNTLHVQLFVKCDIKICSLRKKILKKIRSKYNVWADIRWKHVLARFPDGFTHMFLYKAVYFLITYRTENYRKTPLDKLVENALQRLKKYKAKFGEKRLRTLTLNKEGNLEVVTYNEKPIIENL